MAPTCIYYHVNTISRIYYVGPTNYYWSTRVTHNIASTGNYDETIMQHEKDI